MSGDIGLHEQPIIFYDEEITETKKVVLKHKGIELAYLEINNTHERLPISNKTNITSN